MKRMSLYKMICYCCLIWGTMACTKEDTPEAMWEYTGPVPAILDGPSQAQKMCYALYQKYDLQSEWRGGPENGGWLYPGEWDYGK